MKGLSETFVLFFSVSNHQQYIGSYSATTPSDLTTHADLPPVEPLNNYNNNSNNNNNNNYTSPNALTSAGGGGGGGVGGYNMAPPCSNLKCYDNNGGYTNEYVKDIIDKISEKEQLSKAASYFYDSKSQISPDYYTAAAYNTAYDNTAATHLQQSATHYDQNNNISIANDVSRYDITEIKKSGILSKFYKPDGTPMKSLWDNDTLLKEQRAYKYDPKPLERRKNPRNFVPTDKKTNDYWEKRRKNNQAARKSREDRRKKEIEVLKNVSNLKSDNMKMKLYVQKIMGENQNLKYEVEMLKRL